MDGDPNSDGDESAALAPSIDDSHSHVTTEQKSREDAVPNFAIERDMVDSVSSTRGATIPTQHHTIIFVRFVEEHWLICSIVHGHVQYPFCAVSIIMFSRHRMSRLCERVRSCRFMCKAVVEISWS